MTIRRQKRRRPKQHAWWNRPLLCRSSQPEGTPSRLGTGWAVVNILHEREQRSNHLQSYPYAECAQPAVHAVEI